MPLSSSSVACLVGLQELVRARGAARAETACVTRSSSSQGWPRPRSVDPDEGRAQVVAQQDLAEGLAARSPEGKSRLPVVYFQPIETSWSMKGCSTNSNSGPVVTQCPSSRLPHEKQVTNRIAPSLQLPP